MDTVLFHGADYNPDQWLEFPDILKSDIELMKKAHINCVSLGIFSWSFLEPSEGVYETQWFETIVDTLFDNGISVFLATPSGARPYWLAQKYEEVLRVGADGIRNLPGSRHNHCLSSPIYKEKVKQMNQVLAKKFGHHPAVKLWHISNEYGGECHCELCQEQFRIWLKKRYVTLENLNRAWWTAFWSHRYTSWNQIHSPVPRGELDTNALTLNWKRFVTDQTIDFMNEEIAAIKECGCNQPFTTNMMELYEGLNYHKFKDQIDVCAWDSYPLWGENSDNVETAMKTAFSHDLIRSIKGAPFLLMESTPSTTNWQKVSKLKRSGVHELSALQAIGHGANSIQYFQWRKGRGSSEKFHGAVVSHNGRSDTRVFEDVTKVGLLLEKLDMISKTNVISEVAILFDWENRWAIDSSTGPRNAGMHYIETVMKQYEAFWKLGINVDIIGTDYDLSKYKLVVAPMLYLQSNEIVNKVNGYVENGGNIVMTCWSGIVDEDDLCFMGDVPNRMTETFGMWVEEIDGLYEDEEYESQVSDFNGWFSKPSYKCHELLERIHCTTAQPVAVYGDGFFKGETSVSINETQSGGFAVYIAAQHEFQLYYDIYKELTHKLGILRNMECDFPNGVTISKRTGEKEYFFIQNFSNEETSIYIENNYLDVLEEKIYSKSIIIPANKVTIVTLLS